VHHKTAVDGGVANEEAVGLSVCQVVKGVTRG
jgi:hypothetical protein